MFLHYQLTEQSDIRSARKSSATGDAGDLEPITELDVLYGGAEVQPLWGFTSMSTFITGGPDDEKAFNVATGKGTRFGSRLALRRVAKRASTFSFLQETLTLYSRSQIQPFLSPPLFASPPKAISQSSRSPIFTSASVPASAVTSIRSGSGPASGLEPISTLSSGSSWPSPRPNPTLWSSPAISQSHAPAFPAKVDTQSLSQT